MGTNTKISWTDTTWNPVVGCTRISPGCRGCYAARMAKRQAGIARARRAKGQDPGRSAHYEKVENWDGVELVPEALGDPLKWKRPRRVFVCSMGDLFHKDVPDNYIWRVIEKACEANRHTFQILTKRPRRMADALTRSAWWNNDTPGNICLGVTAENQAAADERIPLLLQTPAANRFVSCEPLLGEIDLLDMPMGTATSGNALRTINGISPGLDLVIVGGETGPGARPMHPEWVRSLRDQCAEAGTAFHFKSWGEWEPACCPGHLRPEFKEYNWGDGYYSHRVGAKRAGHLLDGVEHRDPPE